MVVLAFRPCSATVLQRSRCLRVIETSLLCKHAETNQMQNSSARSSESGFVHIAIQNPMATNAASQKTPVSRDARCRRRTSWTAD